MVSAEPKAPHIFYGLAKTSGGTAVPENSVIQARIGNVHYGQSVSGQTGLATLNTLIHSVNGDGNNYGADVNFQVCANDLATKSAIEGGNEGDSVTFYINGIQATVVPYSGSNPLPQTSTITYSIGKVERVDIIIPSLTASTMAATSSSSACKEATPSGGDPPPLGGGPLPPVEDSEQTLEEQTNQIVGQIGDGEFTPVEAADLLADQDPQLAADVLEQIDSSTAADIIENIATVKAAEIIAIMDPGKAADVLENVATVKAAEILRSLADDKAAGIMEMIDGGKGASIIAQVGARKASNILSIVSPKKAAVILEMTPTERVTEIVKVMSEGKLIERLPEMSAGKLFGIPIEVLFDRLPSVPTEQLVFEETPEVDPSLLPPTVTRVGNRAIYTVPETGELKWAKLVGSPVFIDGILGKFNRRFTNVNINVREIAFTPSGIPPVGPGMILDLPYFQIDAEDASNEPVSNDDITAVHFTLYLSNIWMEGNGIHKWSVQLNRYDDQLNTWIHFPTKRVSEDAEGVFYTAVVPGFSLFAITGSEQLPEQVFAVADLSINPGLPVDGEEITITARVRNTGSVGAVYPANLWINDIIEESQTVVVGPGQTVPINFTIRKPQGSYSIRIERLTGQVRVGAAPLPTATPTPPQVAATATPIQPTPTPSTVVQPTSTPVQTQPTPTATPVTPVSEQATATPMPTATATTAVAADTPVPPTPTAVPTATPSTTAVEEGGGSSVAAIIGVLAGVIAVIGVVGGAVFYAMGRRRND